MGLLSTLLARGKAKVCAVKEYRALVGKIDVQERGVELLRKQRDLSKYRLDIHEATLYLTKKEGTEKITEACIKASVEVNDVTMKMRAEVIDCEHAYKLGLVELTRLYNELQATKLEATA